MSVHVQHRPRAPMPTETTGRWGLAAALGVLVGLVVSLSLSPQLRTWAVVFGIIAALAVALIVVRRRPEVLDK